MPCLRKPLPLLAWVLLLAASACSRRAPGSRFGAEDVRPELSQSAKGVPGGAPSLSDQSNALSALVPAQRSPVAAKRGFIATETRVLGQVAGHELANSAACAECHPGISSDWARSAHRFSSFDNPIYRASIERFRAVRGARASQFCGGCHDPALLVDGALAQDVALADPRATAGVGCLVCHGSVEASLVGNGSYTLNGPLAPLSQVDVGDKVSVSRHRRAVRPPSLASSAACGACHRSHLGPDSGFEMGLVGMDELGDWQRSAFAGTHSADPTSDEVREQSCVDCHMPKQIARGGVQDGKQVSSHEFLGGHTWLYSMTDHPDATRRAAARMRDALRLFVGEARVGSRSWLLPDRLDAEELRRELAKAEGSVLTLDVVVENRGVGHRFPGGVKDVQAASVVLYATPLTFAGLPKGAPLAQHWLKSGLLGVDGEVVAMHDVHRFRAAGYDQTVPPNSARVVRFVVPRGLLARFPRGVRLAVGLRHQSRSTDLQRLACSVQASGLDACAQQPITELLQTELVLSDGGTRRRRETSALFAFTQASLMELTEYLPALCARVQGELADYDLSPEDQARFAVLFAKAKARTGDVDGALSEVAGIVDPGRPAAQMAQAAALARVFRPGAAVARMYPLQAALGHRPDFWQALATAQFSEGGDGALRSAALGLTLEPHNVALLRIAAVASAPQASGYARGAMARYLDNRPADDAGQLRGACALASGACELELMPIHAHVACWPSEPCSGGAGPAAEGSTL